ncbi:hypothetical protein ABW19_dt0200369 [Dactylella cylindrospora]|nr:hypothetical protein ABW19_dt0200369 [Dactylella cylindrospora]
MRIRGLITGNRYTEFFGKCHVASSAGLVTQIDFEGEKTGRFSWGGKDIRYQVKASISKFDSSNEASIQEPLVTVSGSWNGILTITNTITGKEEIFDTTAALFAKVLTPPIEEQDPWESQRAWMGVKDALRKSDWRTATEEKQKIENWQRTLRQREEQEGGKWTPKFFRVVDRCDHFDKMSGMIGLSQRDNMGAIWRYQGDNSEPRRPFRRESPPAGPPDL